MTTLSASEPDLLAFPVLILAVLLVVVVLGPR